LNNFDIQTSLAIAVFLSRKRAGRRVDYAAGLTAWLPERRGEK
jgi:hypothetical protein